MLESLADYRDRARALSAALREIAAEGPLTVGLPSPSLVPDAYAALRRLGLRRPWLARRKEWVRDAIIHYPLAYEILWPHVELELIIDGHLRFFSGTGHPRDSNPALAFLQAKLPPIYWIIVLDQHFERLKPLLNSGESDASAV